MFLNLYSSSQQYYHFTSSKNVQQHIFSPFDDPTLLHFTHFPFLSEVENFKRPDEIFNVRLANQDLHKLKVNILKCMFDQKNLVNIFIVTNKKFNESLWLVRRSRTRLPLYCNLPSKSAQLVQYYCTGKISEITINPGMFVKITLMRKKTTGNHD